MAYSFLFCCFALMGAVGLLAAHDGRRGRVCQRGRGPRVPERVRSDPALRRRANELVAFWCLGAAILALAPLVPLGQVVLSGGAKSVPTAGLMIFAAYGTAVVALAAYPFERIKRLGREEPGSPGARS